MAKKMLIDAAHPEETRVAVADGNRLEEFDYESDTKRQLRGNIYLAKVTRVEPSLQAAFVEYGGNRHGFLAFNEIHPDYYQIPYEDRRKLIEEEEQANAEAEEPVAENGEMDEAEDDEDEILEAERQRRGSLRRYKIQEVIKRRQVMLVQVVKEERGNKGAALTTYLSLAGRYCVLMPNTSRGGGISRKIASATDRKRLKSIISDLEVPAGMGLIIRTAGAKRTKAEIKRDYEYLLRLWERIREQTLKSTAPVLIHEEGNLVKRSIRDLYDKDIEDVLVEGDEAYKQAKEFMRLLMPSHAKKVQPYRERTPLFLRHQVEEQIDQIYNPVVQLKSGGYLVINTTEALVAVDVNSGRATRERNIEATAFKTNMEAAEEACRQMRMRDLAGLIVIDFIDMEESKNNRAVEKKLKDALKADRARVQVGRISQFGLLEMSRQRRRASLLEGSTLPCPTCNGIGFTRSIRSSALHALRRLEEEAVRKRSAKVRISAPADVAMYLLNEKRQQLQALEARFGMSVLVQTDPSLIPPEINIERLEDLDAEAKARIEEESAAEPVVATEPDEVGEPEEVEAEETEKSSDKPRRRRRGGRGRSGQKSADGDGGKPQTEQPDDEEAEADDEAKESSSERADDNEDESDKPKRRRRRGRRGGRGRGRTRGDESQDQSSGDQDESGASDEAKEMAAPDASDADSDDAPAPEPAEKPKRARRSRAKSKTADSRSGLEIVEPIAGGDEAPVTPDDLGAPKPAESSAESAKKAGDVEFPEPGEDEPKPKSRSRRKPAAKKDESKAADASEPAEQTPEPAAKKPEPKPEPNPEKEPETAGADGGKSSRRGWWQRR